MSSAITINIVTPRGVLAQTDAGYVTAPGELGEFQVLPGHLPMLVAIKPGVLTLGSTGGIVVAARYAVGSGYLRINETGTIEVLVEEAVHGSNVDVATARAELAAADAEIAKLQGAPLDGDWQVLQIRRAWAQAQLDAVAN